VRDLKDAKIGIASSSYDIIELPPVKVLIDSPNANRIAGARRTNA